MLSASIVCMRDKSLGSSLLSAENAVTDGEKDGVVRAAGDVEECRSGRQSMRDNVDASSLVHLLSASIFCAHNELPSLLLLSSEGASRHGRQSSWRSSGEGLGWQQSTKDNADASSLVHLAHSSALHSRK